MAKKAKKFPKVIFCQITTGGVIIGAQEKPEALLGNFETLTAGRYKLVEVVTIRSRVEVVADK